MGWRQMSRIHRRVPPKGSKIGIAFSGGLDTRAAVAWLARKVAGFGVRLEAGHVILPGSCTRAIDANPGDSFRAEFSDIGSVSIEFK